MNKKEIAEMITTSTLWNFGKDGHNALSELTETIYDIIVNAKIEQLANMPYPKDEPPEMFIEFYKQYLERQAKELAQLKKGLSDD